MAPSSDNVLDEFSFRTRNCFWNQLKNNSTPLDALVVGGGIVGAGILRELSLRGVSDVVLIEKNDFASGTSGASSKLIHAGIRYLEQAWERIKKAEFKNAFSSFLYVLKASQERGILGALAPHLIKPKPIYLVIGEGDPRSLLSVLLGIWMYYLLQLMQGQVFRPPKMLFRKEAIRWIAPDLNPQRVRAVFSFWDSETDDARLVIENLQCAHKAGGKSLSYVELVSYTSTEHGVQVLLKNKVNEETISLLTKILINAAGPSVDEVRKKESDPLSTEKHADYVDRVAGAHLNVFPPVTSESYYLTAADGRLVFVLHRNEDGLHYSRIGTTERPLKKTDSSDSPSPSPEELEYLKKCITDFFPHVQITEKSHVWADAGIRPLMNQAGLPAFQKSREHRLVQEGRVLHVIGVKLTDFRIVAREVADHSMWRKYNFNLSSNTHHVDAALLRNIPSKNLYAESSMEEIVYSTMVIKPEDYIFRRRGFRNILLQKMDPMKMKWELEKIKSIHES